MTLLAAPILVPLVAAALCLGLARRLRAQLVVGGLAVHAQLALAIPLLFLTWDGGIEVLRIGGWPGTFGIVLACDLLSAMMLALTALLLCGAWWFGVAGAVPPRQLARFYQPLFLLLATGIGWAFLTADLFNLFVAFEMILLGSYALLAHDNRRLTLRAAVRFAVLNMLTGTAFLAGAGLTYGLFGTLNLGDLAIAAARHEHAAMTASLAGLFLFVFATKAAAFPLFFWLPPAYPRVPFGVMPVFTGILTKVGIYAIYRVHSVVFPGEVTAWLQPMLVWIAALTMLVGVLSALAQWSMRSILAFHSISQVGYMLMGLALFSTAGMAGGVFFVVHHALVKSTLFVLAAVVVLQYGSDGLKTTRGILADQPWLAILFLLAAFSLAGIPPLSGFYGKYMLILEAIRQQHAWLAGAALVTSLFTLASMVKIWTTMFVGQPSRTVDRATPRNRALLGAATGISSLLVLLVVASGWLVDASERSARGLADRASYVAAVRGDRAGTRDLLPGPAVVRVEVEAATAADRADGSSSLLPEVFP